MGIVPPISKHRYAVSSDLSAKLKAKCVAQNKLPDDQDIEELCSICEPILEGEEFGVMRYPMKCERKKAREETDVVNVVEWESADDQRYFLLVRRPETGEFSNRFCDSR